jgi:Domain of unknown function (DUF4277)
LGIFARVEPITSEELPEKNVVETETYRSERLDHLGIVAGVCQEIGLAAYLDAQDRASQRQVSVGKATVAMILNGLGCSNRRL